MSSDARLRQTDDGMWYGNHDCACAQGDDHAEPRHLSVKVLELERCVGHELQWFIDDHDGVQRMRGWIAR